MKRSSDITRRIIVLWGVRKTNGSWLRGALWTKDQTGASRYAQDTALTVAATTGGIASILPPEAFPDPSFA